MKKKQPRSNPEASKISPETWKAVSSCSELELKQLARELGRELKTGDRIFLEGPLGAGKTTFARYLLEALGVTQPPEGSPTFAIAHEYFSPRGEVVHIDFYRLKHESEIDDAGIPTYFWERDAIVLCEWASQFPGFLNSVERASARIWKIELGFADSPDQRAVQITRQARDSER